MDANTIRRVHISDKPSKKVLFLGYDETTTSLINALAQKGCSVDHTDKPLPTLVSYDLTVSFGYRHIIKQDVIDALGCPIINLHISYLPYNRGAHPNFWAFYDGTPSGVTIHQMDGGVDTGPIIYQRQIKFAPEEQTFIQTYVRLMREIEALFIQNIDQIIAGNWTAKQQIGTGTHHFIKQLPTDFSGWDSEILNEIKRLKVTEADNE